MSIPVICNIAAWIGVFIFAILLLGDFLKTERSLSTKKEPNEGGADDDAGTKRNR